MKTSVWIIILSAILCAVIFLCPFLIPASNQSSVEEVDLSDVIPDEEDYIEYQIVMLDGPTPAPNVKLYPKEKRFEFMIHPLSSYLPIGHYTIEDNKLILDCDSDENVYVFRMTPLKEDKPAPDYETVESLRLSYLDFLAGESSDLPKFRYSATDTEPTLPFNSGASFIPTKVVITTK